jgi:hypothetical protein
VKESLFPRGVGVEETKQAPEDRAIHDILVKIMGKWRHAHETSGSHEKETVILSSAEVEAYKKAADAQEEEQDIHETIILSPDSMQKEDLYSKQIDDDLEKTRIVYPDDEGVDRQRGVSMDDQDKDKTIIRSSDDSVKDTPAAIQSNDLLDTLIVSASEPSAGLSGPAEPLLPQDSANEQKKATPEWEQEHSTGDKGKKDASKGSVILEETIIVSQKKD